MLGDLDLSRLAAGIDELWPAPLSNLAGGCLSVVDSKQNRTARCNRPPSGGPRHQWRRLRRRRRERPKSLMVAS
jgi:hypothetical protein